MLVYIFALFFATELYGEYSIVFIHVGDEIPSHTKIALRQARLFNPRARIIMLGSQQALKRIEEQSRINEIELCAYEGLKKTAIHRKYEQDCAETSQFWRYTSERFLYLWDLMNVYSLSNIFHLENDVMLYADLESYLPQFQKLYPGIAATFDNDERCIPGFVWVSHPPAMKSLASYLAERAPERLNDMQALGAYRKERSYEYIKTLPIIMQAYSGQYPLVSPHGHTTAHPEAYWNHADSFHAIFDAAAIGQYLGGIDPVHKNNGPGFINESCLFNPKFLKYRWQTDDQGRLVPYAILDAQCFKIMNLHIHSKRLQEFTSTFE